jgi:hypothetical protein
VITLITRPGFNLGIIDHGMLERMKVGRPTDLHPQKAR